MGQQPACLKTPAQHLTTMIRVALRFDDPSAASLHDLEAALFALLERYGVTATVGVIPYRCNGDEYQPLTADNGSHLITAQRKGIIEIAQHGYSHEKRGCTAKGQPTEFAGLSEAEQTRLISEGRSQLGLLFGCGITGFIPPWNTCDTATAAAVRELGFSYLSASLAAPAISKLTWLPRTCQATNIVAVVKDARRYSWLSPIVIAVMHHYDFRESGSPHAPMSLDGFEERLAWLAAQRDVQTLSLDSLSRDCAGRIGPGQLDTLKGILPWRLRRWLPENHLLTFP